MSDGGRVYASPRRDAVAVFVSANPGCSTYQAVKETGRSSVEDSSGRKAAAGTVELGLIEERPAPEGENGKRLFPAGQDSRWKEPWDR